MAKPISATKGPRKHPGGGAKITNIDINVIAEKAVSSGMITSIDSADIPNSALTNAQNCRTRFDRTETRFGTSRFNPPPPDADPVLALYFFGMYDLSGFTLRFTPSTINELDAPWTAYTAGAGGTLTGGPTDRFDIITAFNRLFFANGVDPVQEVDTTAKEYKAFGNCPTWKYITAFDDRVFGAYLIASTLSGVDDPPNPVYIGWSGAQDSAGGIDEWDPTVEETAGRQPLLESPGDLSDYITGMFAFTNYIVVLRERSVWLGTKQAIPTAPVRFFTAWPGFGCDCPSSAQVCEQSLIWLDTRTKTVWQYPPNGTPTRIGEAIEETLLDGLTDPSAVFSGYDPIQNEYYVGFPLQASMFSKIWVYNMRTQTWSYDLVFKATSIQSIQVEQAGGTTIDELVGAIDDLVGTINDLSGFNPNYQALLWGRTDGEIVIADPTTALDFVDGNPQGFDKIMDSKDFDTDVSDGAVVCVRVELQAILGGQFAVYYRKNNYDWVPYYVVTFQPDDMKRPRIFNFKKNVRARRFAWRIISNDAAFKLLGYEVHVSKAGMSRHVLGNTTT